MKIAASEAQWSTCTDCPFSVFQIGGFTESDKTPSFSIEIPDLLSYLATGSSSGSVAGLNNLNDQYSRQYGRGNYKPPVRTIYVSMRVMAGVGTVIALIAILAPTSSGGGARAPPLVPVDRRRQQLPPVRRHVGGLGADGGRPAAVDRPGCCSRRATRIRRT